MTEQPKPVLDLERCPECGEVYELVPHKDDWEWGFEWEALGDTETPEGNPRCRYVPIKPKPREQWTQKPLKVCGCFFPKPKLVDPKKIRKALVDTYKFVRDSEKAAKEYAEQKQWGTSEKIAKLGEWARENRLRQVKCEVSGCPNMMEIEAGKRLRSSDWFGTQKVICDGHKRELRNTRTRRAKEEARRREKTKFGTL